MNENNPYFYWTSTKKRIIEVRPISLLIVDDHPMVTEGLKAILSRVENIEVKGCVGDADEAISFLRNNDVNVAMVDINLPGVSGIELCEKIKGEFRDVRVLGMSSFQERSYISGMIQAGASGYLVKSASKEEIVKAVHAAVNGKLYLSVDVDMAQMKPGGQSNAPVLTRREKEVLNLIAEGYTNHQMAEKLFVSPHTIDSHRKNLLNKFEVKNTAALINSAVRYNLLNS
ncbi:MAG TPA: response regulator transcription factor [Chryseosolibacter sp.]|nr:response regulator transcription factor [Chryseosolibacter sp.]